MLVTSQGPSTPLRAKKTMFTSTPFKNRAPAQLKVFNDSESSLESSIEVIEVKTPRKGAPIQGINRKNAPALKFATIPRTPKFARPTISWMAKHKNAKFIQDLVDGKAEKDIPTNK